MVELQQRETSEPRMLVWYVVLRMGRLAKLSSARKQIEATGPKS